VYDGVSKIFRTDTVKTIKLTIRPIGHYHPRSSFLTHVYTRPIISSIFGTLPGSRFLLVSSTLDDLVLISSVVSNRRPFSFNLIFGNRKKSQGDKPGEYGGWGDDSHFVLGDDGSVRRGAVMAKQPGLFSPKFGTTSSHVFTQSLQNFAVEPGIHSLACWHKFFVLPKLLYRWRHQSRIFCIPPHINLGYMKTGISGFKTPFVSLIPNSVFLWFVAFERQHRFCETGGCLTTTRTIRTKVLTFSQVNFNLTLAILLCCMFYNEKL
jgi:hypothetical protein